MSKQRSDAKSAYESKRNFERTPEPSGMAGRRTSKAPIFVIQQHDATTLHFDFRLEIDGKLASWAVPKGPSTDPREKRLAVRVEDHPLAYASFEGCIPEGEYGAGPVIVWDQGTYENLRRREAGAAVSMRESLEDGRVEIWLEGEKIRGGYALIHSRLGGKERNWLLIKMKDEGSDARRKPAKTEPQSVRTGRTLEDVRRASRHHR